MLISLAPKLFSAACSDPTSTPIITRFMSGWVRTVDQKSWRLYKRRCRKHAVARGSGIGLILLLTVYGTIAATSLEYKLSSLLASTAVTT